MAFTVERLDSPHGYCGGWGPGDFADRKRFLEHQHCDGGTGLLVARRARWLRADGLIQCGTCKRRDETTAPGVRWEPDDERSRPT